ncbi:MAG: hypothetical protein JJ891_06915 [Rhizobiaceae bacterium]|nr:hypothetical protein [Rhizobiaceae bacterium]
MRELAFDIETNGLLDIVETIHCLDIIDTNTGEIWECASSVGREQYPGLYHPIEYGLEMLHKDSGNIIIAHNGVGYDVRAIEKLYPGWEPATVRDTMILAKMIWPADVLMKLDMPRFHRGTLPGNLIKRHSLEAWGYRLGEMKGEYAKDEGHDTKWLVWRKDMQDYCKQDIIVTSKLWNLIKSHLDGTSKQSGGFVWSDRCVELEHKVAKLIIEQEEHGFGFDIDNAISLAGELKNRQAELERELIKVFGSWWEALDDKKTGTLPARDRAESLKGFKNVTIPRFSEKTGKELSPYVGPPKAHYSTDAPFVRVKRVTFNPKSRQHLGDRLQTVFGWTPAEWGGKNMDQAKVDETTIKEIPETVLSSELKEMILEYLVVSKTLGALNDGKKNWINLYDEDGSIHGRVDPLGTVSHRGAHFNPNLGQVSSVSKDKEDNIIYGWKGGFGYECRSLFIPKCRDWKQTGTDASGLELRLLGHYLHKFDNGKFSERVCDPDLDIHSENSKITGLSRADTKTVTYAFLYGAGPLRIGQGVGVEDDEIEELANSSAAKNYCTFMKRLLKKKYVQLDNRSLAQVVRGQQVSKRFLEGIAGLKDLKKVVVAEAERGFIQALDGRKLSIRKPHAAINQLLQGGGAIVCKEWMVRTRDTLENSYGLRPGEDFAQMAWVHDELQFENRDGLGEVIGTAAEQAIRETGESLNFKGVLATDFKPGNNWAECH